ncbi:hypothetical protein E3N88_42586 [Mikania micrantha]|uniref:Uncharacterized protein n=1 Tax=Mikania micrantha TaxID=192012 RepID=A0A5N6LHD6_9ASTR|nr:hypothetical protein E3N88_42586 [Mikania micrantha]
MEEASRWICRKGQPKVKDKTCHRRYGWDLLGKGETEHCIKGEELRKREGEDLHSASESHPPVPGAESMADPTPTPTGVNTSASKVRRDETPTSAHPYLSDMTNVDVPVIGDYSDEEEAEGFRITPEFVHSHRTALKAQLEEIEKAEKLKEVQARLTFVGGSSATPAKEAVPVDELLTTLLEAIRQRKEPVGKETFDLTQAGGNEALNPLLQPYHLTNFTDMSKFTKRIAEAPLPGKLKVPLNVGKYDGSSDPDDHLHAYAGVGKVGRWNLPTWCHMLVQTLTRAAHLWFDSLPPGSIDSYEELRDKFLKQFNQKKKAIKNPNEILHIRRRDDEKPQLCEKLGEDFLTTFDGLMDKVRAFVRGKDTNLRAREWDLKKSPGPYRAREGADSQRKASPYPTKGKPYVDSGRPSFAPYKPSQRPYPEKFTPLTKMPIRQTVAPGKRNRCGTSKGKELARGEEGEKRRSYVDMVRRHQNNESGDNKRKRTFDEETPPWLECSITFPPLKYWEAQEAPLNVAVDIVGHRVARIHVDGGSGSEIMYEHCFRRLDSDVQNLWQPDNSMMIGFSGEASQSLGKVTLPFNIGEYGTQRMVHLTFYIIRAPTKYNAILGRPGIKALRAIVSIAHGAMKFPTPAGIATVSSSSEKVASLARNVLPKSPDIEEWILNDEYSEIIVKVGSHLTNKCKTALKEMLIRHCDIFAWTPRDMWGIPRSQAEHRINARTSCKPVKQKRRNMGIERSRAVIEETKKLLLAGIAREVQYPAWTSNPVMVRKSDGKWRMCIDFKDVNKATPKDCYPLPEMDAKIDSLHEFPLRCFLDAYKGYHQIQMAIDDEEKTAFYTDEAMKRVRRPPFRNAQHKYEKPTYVKGKLAFQRGSYQ